MAQQEHPIFDDIYRGHLGAVQQRVLADAAVLEERVGLSRRTPLIYAIIFKKPAIAVWLLEHRGHHDVNTTNGNGATALHYASDYGPLAVVQALVAAGANPAALDQWGNTPLIRASDRGHTDIVAFLLQLPAVKAGIDAISQEPSTALACASSNVQQPIVQLLLGAGADPTIPAGPRSPLNQAVIQGHHAVAALLSHTIAEADRVRMCAALVGTRKGLYKNLYLELMGYLVHAWAIKGAADEDSDSEEGSESSSEEDASESSEEEGASGSGSGSGDE